MIAALDARKRTDLCLADLARLLEVIGASR
jgi:hypothetical protein